MSKSISSFFKKRDTNSGSNGESVNNPDDASYVNNINHNDTHISVNNNNSVNSNNSVLNPHEDFLGLYSK